MHPIGSDLWREMSVQMERKHSLSPVPSDSVNTPFTHINHHVTVNRHCALPLRLKSAFVWLCLFPVALGNSLEVPLLFPKLCISISNRCAYKCSKYVHSQQYALVTWHPSWMDPILNQSWSTCRVFNWSLNILRKKLYLKKMHQTCAKQSYLYVSTLLKNKVCVPQLLLSILTSSIHLHMIRKIPRRTFSFNICKILNYNIILDIFTHCWKWLTYESCHFAARSLDFLYIFLCIVYIIDITQGGEQQIWLKHINITQRVNSWKPF